MVDIVTTQTWPVVCLCDLILENLGATRLLPLDSAMSFDDGDRVVIRICACGAKLGIWLDRKQQGETDVKTTTRF